MRTQYINLAANEVKTFESAGGYFEILRAANDLARIDWITEDGGFSDPWELVKEGVFGYLPFKGFRITNGPTAQTIKVLFGQGSGGNRAAPVSGSVGITGTAAVSVAQVVDVEDQEMRSAKLGRTYQVTTGYTAPINTYSKITVLNPAGSGVVALIKKTVLDLGVVANAAQWGATKLFSYSATPGFSAETPIGAKTATLARSSSCRFFVEGNTTNPPAFGFTGASSKTPMVKGASTLGERDHSLIALGEGEAFVLWVLNGAVAALETQLSVGWIETNATIDQLDV